MHFFGWIVVVRYGHHGPCWQDMMKSKTYPCP
uniref:Uncharacterized protein n=1 Tax=Anopheles quadriannulatus TaxID=34691 RepID=A0A182XTE3_ANOQN